MNVNLSRLTRSCGWRCCLPQLGDPEEKRKLIEQTLRNTGVAPDKVEEIFRLLAQTLLDMQRSN